MYSNHGGGCCGIRHLYGLDRMSLEAFDRQILEHFQEPRGRAFNDNRILEVVLSERQIEVDPADGRFDRSIIDAGGWPAVLASRGFKLCESWRNTNSGNMCYRFVKLAGEGFAPAPAWWTEEALQITEPALVECIVRPALIAVDDTVRHPDYGLGSVVQVNPETFRILFESGEVHTVPLGTVIKVSILEEQYPINPRLPIEVVFEDGTTLHVNQAGTRGRGAAIVTEYGWFHADNGMFGERTYLAANGRRGGRLRNVPTVTRPRTDPPAPVPPAVVLTEYFALFQNGSMRGPFETREEIREAYPRVRSFRIRRVLSNGNIHNEDERL